MRLSFQLNFPDVNRKLLYSLWRMDPMRLKLFISTAKVSQYMHYLQHTLTDGILCSLFCWLLSQLYCAQTHQWASTAIRDWSPCTPMHLLCSNSGIHSGCRTCICQVPSCQAFYYLNGAFVVWITKYSVQVTNVTDQLQQGRQPRTVHGCTTCALKRARTPPTTIPFHLSWLLCMFGISVLKSSCQLVQRLATGLDCNWSQLDCSCQLRSIVISPVASCPVCQKSKGPVVDRLQPVFLRTGHLAHDPPFRGIYPIFSYFYLFIWIY